MNTVQPATHTLQMTTKQKGCEKMSNFLKGILLGVGVGLLIAPMKGEEMRRLVSERANELRGYLPENEQLATYKDQVSSRLNQTAGTLKDYAQQAATTVKSSASNLSDITQGAGSEVKKTGQDITGTTKETIKSNSNSTSTNP
jgi:gas vesicle protein